MDTNPTRSARAGEDSAGHAALVLGRQEPLRERYRSAPEDARITDCASTVGNAIDDPFHATVEPGSGRDARWRVGIHRAVGGYHDLANPGDILCAALASCFDTTLRIIAARVGVPITDLRVAVTGSIDVRGTLAVTPGVPVGMQQIRCEVDLEVGSGVPDLAVERLLAAAERACVVLQTLRNGVPVDLTRSAPVASRDGIGEGEFSARSRSGGRSSEVHETNEEGE
jgi:uncharacterized OsmC-like protein